MGAEPAAAITNKKASRRGFPSGKSAERQDGGDSWI
jgi:hypothetical protein